MTDKHVSIIGAGVSGMSAAIKAAELGLRADVYEHSDSALTKLSITGNRKCNFTNTDISVEHYHGDKELISNVISSFTYDDCIEFYRSLGVKPKIVHYRFDDFGYVYPDNMDANGIKERFLKRASDLGVNIFYSFSIDDISSLDKPVIFACGSNAYPVTGSDSSIYPVIKNLNIPFKTYRPALCALYTKDPYLLSMKGKRSDTEVILITDDNEYRSFGEVQYNMHSISGIPVMQLSRYVPYALDKAKNGHRMPLLIIDGHEYEIYKTAGFEASQCCSGGVDTMGINKATLESLNNSGIFFAGEMIDIDGDCGGFNLHFAVASGILSAISAYNYTNNSESE